MPAVSNPAVASTLPPRYNVLGVGVSALTLAQARDLVLRARGAQRLGYVCLCNVHSVGEARADPDFRRILNRSYLTTPDGMPLVWLAPHGVERVYGPDLLGAVCNAGRSVRLRHFFYGGRPGIATELAQRLAARYPGLEIAGTFTPPFRPLQPDEANALRAEIARTRPDVIWVGLSTPKQERFMAAHWQQLEAGLLIGVGAAFDFHAGRVRQAPRWIQRSGFEWLFRLCLEPRRLVGRYLKTNPIFLLRVALQKTGVKRYPLVD
ncbi:WecB/TagA/CpsF family glycosyltransferase [Opitutus terrae]|uniref:Glycosyl transferase, WecB/TagA/CpsF family n=1 Tax=Opitutus terrae (strain DSM 11246 / JCM 15787 / PB90-1) TaxID=452637 RepID=B1ZTR9_OPITP|nr:WecB/TagA/CpsF family glycosyltransferase [Opitutus terrae]ACB74855.1 glycosyl transferase, WecB/TagA/CpsF family [Opitutus terrae PB90-1]